MTYLFDGSEWTFPLIEKTWSAIDKIGTDDLNLTYYDVQIDVISAEQMIDAYSSHAMPVMYNHWSFGKSFVNNDNAYKKGRQGLAYEVVINTDPCIAYLMEDNTMTMQALVLAHASVGHNSFFKNNYMFKDWTDASYIIPYIKYAKKYIKQCEEDWGSAPVERILDACHALQLHGVFKYDRRDKKDGDLQRKAEEMHAYNQEQYDPMWSTVPNYEGQIKRKQVSADRQAIPDFAENEPDLPEENILYFIEKYSPSLMNWEKEIVRIVRQLAQYFYPQMQTQLMNEGWATFTHYEIMTLMEEREMITPGSYLEFLQSHSGVIYQPTYDSPHFSGINVYALGFAMFRDLKRIIQNPTEEDRYWFPDIAGLQDYQPILQEIAYNFKDESFVLQYLSPKVIRDFKLFILKDTALMNKYEITGIHDDDDIWAIRQQLSNEYNLGLRVPEIEVTGFASHTDRELKLRHHIRNGVPLDQSEKNKVLALLGTLWDYPISLVRSTL